MSAAPSSSDDLNHVPHLETQQPESPCVCSSWVTYTLITLLVVVVLFKYKNPLQFHVRLIVFLLVIVADGIICFPLTLLRPFNTANFAAITSLFRAIIHRIYGFRFTIENAELLKLKQPYIILCNHQSVLDLMTMATIWPDDKTTILAKKEILYTGPVGLTLWLAGITFIDRMNKGQSKGIIVDLSERINHENFRVWVFPEGTRSVKTELLPFKKGAFHLAIQAQIPLLCVVTSSYLNFYNKKERRFDLNGEIKVRVLEPVQTRGLTLDSVGELSNRCRDLMQKEFDLLNEEMKIDRKYYPSTPSSSSSSPESSPESKRRQDESQAEAVRRRDVNNNSNKSNDAATVTAS